MKKRWLAIAALVGGARAGRRPRHRQGNRQSQQVDVHSSGKISIVGVGPAPSRRRSKAVLEGFTAKYPGVKVSYKSTGDNTPTVLSTAVAGGNPPDLASVVAAGPRQGLRRRRGRSRTDRLREGRPGGELPGVDREHREDQRPRSTGSSDQGGQQVDGWYNVASFKDAGMKPPKTWADFIEGDHTLKASGQCRLLDRRRRRLDAHRPVREHLPPAGGRRRSTTPLSTHKIKWTDPSVDEGAEDDGADPQDSANMAGGTSGALQTDFPTSVFERVLEDPEGRDGDRGRLRAGRRLAEPARSRVAATTSSRSRRSATRAGYVEGGGDELMMFKDNPATRALVTYLATPAPPSIWAKRGGYTAPAKTCASARIRTRSPAPRRPRSAGEAFCSTSPTSSRRRSARRSGRASSRSSRTS